MSKDKSGNDVLTDEWLNHRLNIFNNYCLPSVVSQTNRNFLWLIYFDSTTNETVRQQNTNLEKQYPGLIKIIYADGANDFLQRYCNDIISFCSGEEDYVITSRLDNDDIIHKDFMKVISESFSGQPLTAVNFVKILMLNPEIKGKLHIDYLLSNHFISLIEKITPGGIQGCYSRKDREWGGIDTIQINDKPYCIEIISGKNLINDFRGFPVLKTTALSDFQLKFKLRNSFFDIDNFKIWKMSWKKIIMNSRIKVNPSKGLNIKGNDL